MAMVWQRCRKKWENRKIKNIQISYYETNITQARQTTMNKRCEFHRVRKFNIERKFKRCYSAILKFCTDEKTKSFLYLHFLEVSSFASGQPAGDIQNMWAEKIDIIMFARISAPDDGSRQWKNLKGCGDMHHQSGSPEIKNCRFRREKSWYICRGIELSGVQKLVRRRERTLV
jgi:hypothetical protein